MKISQKIAVSLAAGFGALTIAAGFATWNSAKVASTFEVFVAQDVGSSQAVNTLYAQGLQMGQAVRNIVLDPQNKQAYENLMKARKDYAENLDKLKVLSRDSEVNQALLEKIGPMQGKLFEAQDKVVQLVKEDRNQAIEFLVKKETPAWRELRGTLVKAIQAEAEAAEKAKSEIVASTQRMVAYATGLVLAALAFGLLIGLWLVRAITKPLQGAVKLANAVAVGDLTQRIFAKSDDEIGELLHALAGMSDGLRRIVSGVHVRSENILTAAAQIGKGNEDLSARTENQASSLEQTSAAMEELGATVQNNSDNAMQANSLSQQASGVATEGGAVVADVVATMSDIHTASQKIADIISVIDGIAFQTNILALNAAVEAARAGEQGRGFAVVASEVRSLAGRSSAAAKEIKALIEDSTQKVSQGADQAGKAGQTMQDVVTSIRKVADMVGEISTASREQTTGVQEVGAAVRQMDQATQQNAAMVEEIAAAASSLHEQAKELSGLVAVFKL